MLPSRGVNKVKLFREAKRWTKAELARQSGISESQVGRIESGESTPNLTTAQAMVRALGVHVEAVFPDLDHQKAAV